MEINKPLTEQELNELDEFLLSDSVPENCMFLKELDGFLTGIVIGPKTIMPNVWLDEIFGGRFAYNSLPGEYIKRACVLIHNIYIYIYTHRYTHIYLYVYIYTYAYMYIHRWIPVKNLGAFIF